MDQFSSTTVGISPSVTKLDTHTATLFRRGQIITKVPDVVRELVDNAVDAGALRIQLLLDNFGLDKIELRDDGHGIEAIHLRNVVSGGYTSKLDDVNHLSCGNQYGFRGEGLSSICSFGTVTITTKTELARYATKYIFDSTGKIVSESQVGNGRGTTVIVKDLFLAFPVRRNFIKQKSRTVSGLKEIELYLKHVGIGNPPIYLSLAHNLNSIWTKPVLKTCEEVLSSIWGVQVAKRLVKCGPIQIPTPVSSSANLVNSSTLECFLPQVPIDSKLMISTANRMCLIIINRRRVEMTRIDKLLRQYIFGMLQTTSQINLKGKHPVALVKIDTPPTMVDFNREIDKSKVFLQQETEVLAELERVLKSFYPIDLNDIKENLYNEPVSVVGTKKLSETVSSFSKPVLEGIPEEVERTQNILTFLSDIPTVSKENFSKSPIKGVGTTERLFPPQSEVSALSSLVNSARDTNSTSSKFDNATTTDRAWAFGRMEDEHRNVIESVSIVRPTRSNCPSPLDARRTATSTESLSNDEFYARLQSCHTKISPGMSLPFGKPKPTKRPRLSPPPVLAVQKSLLLDTSFSFPPLSKPQCNPRVDIDCVSGSSTGKKQRQTTLTSFSAWKKSGLEASSSCDNEDPIVYKRVDSSLILKKSRAIDIFLGRDKENVDLGREPEDFVSRVIGKLPGKPLHVVQIDSLLGVFSAPNFLDLAPLPVETTIDIATAAMFNEAVDDTKTVERLLTEFPKLSTDEFSEEKITRVFSLLRDLDEPMKDPEDKEKQMED